MRVVRSSFCLRRSSNFRSTCSDVPTNKKGVFTRIISKVIRSLSLGVIARYAAKVSGCSMGTSKCTGITALSYQPHPSHRYRKPFTAIELGAFAEWWCPLRAARPEFTTEARSKRGAIRQDEQDEQDQTEASCQSCSSCSSCPILLRTSVLNFESFESGCPALERGDYHLANALPSNLAPRLAHRVGVLKFGRRFSGLSWMRTIGEE